MEVLPNTIRHTDAPEQLISPLPAGDRVEVVSNTIRHTAAPEQLSPPLQTGGRAEVLPSTIRQSTAPGQACHCPEGHTLVKDHTPDHTFFCSECNSIQPKNAVLYSCEPCDYSKVFISVSV